MASASLQRPDYTFRRQSFHISKFLVLGIVCYNHHMIFISTMLSFPWSILSSSSRALFMVVARKRKQAANGLYFWLSGQFVDNAKPTFSNIFKTFHQTIIVCFLFNLGRDLQFLMFHTFISWYA